VTMDELRRYNISLTHEGKPHSWNGLLTSYWAQACSIALAFDQGKEA
jgi:hypothetical protein